MSNETPARLPFLCVCLALLACKGSASGELTHAKLGTLSGSAQSLRLATETSRLPLVPSKSGDIAKNFGICFHYEHATKLGEVAILVQPPGAIKIDSVELEKEKAGTGVRMKLPPFATDAGDFCQEMFFEAGDPPGRWHFELLNGTTVVRTWDVEVYTP